MPEGKTKRRRVVLREGDVFEFDAPDGRRGYGVIIVGGGVPYVIILQGLHLSPPSMAELEADAIALVGWTMDALVYHGRWRVIAHGYSLRPDIPYPNYLVGLSGEQVVTDFKGRFLGPPKEDELGVLDHKSSRSPIGYEKAFLALHGFGEWQESYEELTFEYVRRRVTRPLAV